MEYQKTTVKWSSSLQSIKRLAQWNVQSLYTPIIFNALNMVKPVVVWRGWERKAGLDINPCQMYLPDWTSSPIKNVNNKKFKLKCELFNRDPGHAPSWSLFICLCIFLQMFYPNNPNCLYLKFSHAEHVNFLSLEYWNIWISRTHFTHWGKPMNQEGPDFKTLDFNLLGLMSK